MRYHLLDNLRGLTFISMVLFHTMWDLVYIFGVDAPWFHTQAAYVWQQSILYCFVLISGFCWGLGHHPLKRGLIVFGCGLVVTAVTFVAMPDDPAIYGVLSLLGTSMLLMIVLEKALKHVPAAAGFALSLVLFVLLRGVPYGYLGFDGLPLVELPDALYANIVTAAFGFQPASGFVSSDYVPLIPWLVLFICGYFLMRLLQKPAPATNMQDTSGRPELRLPAIGPWPLVSLIGRHSLIIYMLHQPVIYGVLMALSAAGILG